MFIRQRNEHTIAQRASVSGRGYWSGDGVNVRFFPAKVGSGIRFFRTDLPGSLEIVVSPESRSAQSLRTCVECGEARVEMVEHVLAALYSLQIDNCLIEIDRGELPGLDGSSAAYVDALRNAGLVMQARTRRQIVIQEAVRVGDANHWIEATPSPDGRMHLEYRLEYTPDSPITPQTFGCVLTPTTFMREIAPARTFVTSEQAAALRAAGLGQHVTNRDLLVFGKNGPVDNLLRYSDECARHKLLDLIGDLSIVGADVVGCIVSYRGGHQLNAQMATTLTATTITTAPSSLSTGRRKAA